MAADVLGYGLLLPHFGEFASRDNLIRGAIAAERYGFEAIWVRDHLIFHPHGMEGQDRTHVEPFVTLGLLAGVTERIVLGTASLIPYRHPIYTALSLASLEYVTGPGRVIAGFGIGTFDHEFEAVGLGGIKRGALLREQVEIMRRIWTGESVSHQGEHYTFDDVDIHPTPPSGQIPIWYCGTSPLSLRKAVEYCSGWMPGRITIKTFRNRVARLRELAAEAGREVPTISAIPIISPAATREEALAAVDWRGMMKQATASQWATPDSGGWNTPEDLEGALIAGTAQDIIEGAARYREEGIDHLVFDLRFHFRDWLDHVQLLGEEVLPALRRSEATSSPVPIAV
jgi:probable F420-dependent oxidoreductase